MLGLLSVAAAAFIYVLVIFVQVSKTLPTSAEIGNFKPSEGTIIYFSDGKPMAILSSEKRTPIKLDQMNRELIDATIAIEDTRFYEHKGIDFHGIARAIYRDVAGGDLKKEGASTITQQLARNIEELGLSKQKKLSRKIGEAILAVRIEQTFSKDEILENYLNQIYYGAGAYGVEAAATTYFHKKAKELSLSESAFLAGLPKHPSRYSNPAFRDDALQRRDVVLDRMVDTGKITMTQAEMAKQQTLKIYKAEPNSTRVFAAPHFVNAVIAQLASEENGFGADAVYAGLSIYTTLDSKIQKAAEETLAYGIHHYGEQANQGALVCIDPRTGYIRAMVGGLDYKKDQFNVVTQAARIGL
jgi:penicillin-binding protein 1A